MAINSSSFQVGDSGGTSRRGTPKEGIENWQRSLSSFLIVHSMHTVDVPQSPSTCNTNLGSLRSQTHGVELMALSFASLGDLPYQRSLKGIWHNRRHAAAWR